MTIPQLKECIRELGRRRLELERALTSIDPQVGRTAMFGSPATVYKLALEHELIDGAEHDQAKKLYGRCWRYAGD